MDRATLAAAALHRLIPALAPVTHSVMRQLSLALVALALVGCGSLGPVAITRDREDYITAVAESWKDQTLINIVRIRYGDAPTFLDVSSVITAYSIGGQVAASASVSSNLTSSVPWNLATFGANATYVDRPTITYTPLTGNKFTKSILTPIPPSAVFELIQAGYPSDAILKMTTRAINGIRNSSSISGRARESDPEFYPLIDSLWRLQQSGSVSMRLEKRGADEIGILILSHSRTAEVESDLDYVERTLKVRPGKNGELIITFGANPRSDQEIAVLTRSMLDILTEIAAGIDVPAAHVADGETFAAARSAEAPNPHDRPLVRILSGKYRPADAFAAVRYGDTWYWIAKGDFASKRLFTFLMMLFSLAESGVSSQPPVLTLPIN